MIILDLFFVVIIKQEQQQQQQQQRGSFCFLELIICLRLVAFDCRLSF